MAYSASSFSKETISPVELLASREVGSITVGRQHEACTAERMRTCGLGDETRAREGMRATWRCARERI